ncbi:putative quinol monooxygenase [Eilatimonas milleporae]|nr:putative quinol monooxygenase [Eilatimonas milleporae]
MHINRRTFVAGTVAALWAPNGVAGNVGSGEKTIRKDESPMFGLIGKITVVDGQRDTLMSILLEGTTGMPGCLSYVIAADSGDDNVLWVTEVWDNSESHAASLQLPAVRDAIAKGRPLIAGMTPVATTAPAGGHGL